MIETITNDYTQEVKYLLKSILLEGLLFSIGMSVINVAFRGMEFDPASFIISAIWFGLIMGISNLVFTNKSLEDIPVSERQDYNYKSYQKARVTSTLSLIAIKEKLESMDLPISKLTLDDNILKFKSKNGFNWFGNMNTIVMEKSNEDYFNYKLISEPATILSFRDYGRSYVNIIKMKNLLK